MTDDERRILEQVLGSLDEPDSAPNLQRVAQERVRNRKARAADALYELLDEQGWADHYRCGWEDGQPPSDGMCGKEWAERQSVGEMVNLVLRKWAVDA